MSLETKYKLYKRLIKTQQDKHGFIESDKCDSLLFSGLVGSTQEVYIDIKSALAEDGSWQRRPIELPSCYSNGHWNLLERIKSCLMAKTTDIKILQKIFEAGGSSISRDMLLGLAWYAYYNKRLDISESVIKYALSHRLVMGEGTLTRTILTPSLLSTYAWVSYRLGGPKRSWLRYLPHFESKKVTDFQAHLSVLHILLRNKLTNKPKYLDLLQFHADRQPENAFFQAATGNIDKAYTILNNENYFPSSRLPTSEDRYEPYLWQRDYGKDWISDLNQSVKIHSGADFIFCYWLINNYNEE